jgi:HSP20 family protein
MADITRWDPFAEMASFRNAIDRMFDEVRPFRSFFGDGNGTQTYFPVDVFETDEDVVVKASLPGFKPEDIDISVHGDVLTIKGELKEEKEDKAKNWYRRERRYGSTVRQITLPAEVSTEKADAQFEEGVLRLTLPKSEAAKPKQIKVHGGGKVIEAAKG